MKILNIDDFTKVADPVKTEETIRRQLVALASEIITEYVYVSIPLAYFINTMGVIHVQKIINQICEEHKDKKLFFVCQHILVNKINFNEHLVFTPHATILDSYIPIPHYSCNFDISMSKKWEERKYKFSFIGSFQTHPVRRRIYETLKDREDCCVIDTGIWHFESDKKRQEENARKYVEILGDTKFSLCPRGTGPSTIRMWESMAMGSKPVVFSDLLKYPLQFYLSSELWTSESENFSKIDLSEDIAYDNAEYFKYFNNENLFQSIIKEL